MSPAAGGMWAAAALRVLGKHMARSSKMLRSKLAAASRTATAAELQPIVVRSRQPIHPAAILRQQKSNRVGGIKWLSTKSDQFAVSVRRFLTTDASGSSFRLDRSKFPVSNTSRAVARFTGRAPFASTLRPNLTGGALPRTAGGYAAPGAGRVGGARYFSHTPTAPAQVVQNVSQAMRAFWLSGQRARFDGVGPDGQKRYKAINAAQEQARNKLNHIPRNAPGSFVDFHISPTVTAVSPLASALSTLAVSAEEGIGAAFKAQAAGGASLNADGFLDILSGDFARALQDLAAIMADLKALSDLGDLPITMERNDLLRVRFPGVDADTVERLCADIGLLRGVVGQDPGFDATTGVNNALRFPYAPDGGSCAEDHVLTSPGGSMRSRLSSESSMSGAYFEDPAILDEYEENPWLLSPSSVVEESTVEGYESMSPHIATPSGDESLSEDFEGLEGIYKFLEECDHARGRFRNY